MYEDPKSTKYVFDRNKVVTLKVNVFSSMKHP